MDLNKWNRSVGSESDNRENKIEICKTNKNLIKAHDQEQQQQQHDNDNADANANEDESKTAATTIIISPLNRTLLKKPTTTHKNANNYNNLNDNNNNNKNNLNSENLTCNINCSVNENDYQCKNNDYQFSKPMTKNLKQQQQQQHNNNFLSKRAENTFACSMLEKCASANFQNSSSSNVESDNEQEQEEEKNSKAQAQQQLQLQLQLQLQQLQTQNENQNDRPVDVDATNKHSSRNAAHITGFETGVVGVCCSSISVGASVDFAAIGDSSNSSFILNLHKNQNLAANAIKTTTTTNIETLTTTTTTTNASNSTSNTNETSVTAKCHNCCNNNNNNNNSSNNNNNSSNYCRN